MAGIDLFNQFPNSRMAQAVKLGQSQFRSVENLPVTTPVEKSGTATMASVTGTTSTATLLALAGLATRFTDVMFTITTSAAGVLITRASTGFSRRYAQGQTATFKNVSVADPIVVTTDSADVVNINYLGY